MIIKVNLANTLEMLRPIAILLLCFGDLLSRLFGLANGGMVVIIPLVLLLSPSLVAIERRKGRWEGLVLVLSLIAVGVTRAMAEAVLGSWGQHVALRLMAALLLLWSTNPRSTGEMVRQSNNCDTGVS